VEVARNKATKSCRYQARRTVGTPSPLESQHPVGQLAMGRI